MSVSCRLVSPKPSFNANRRIAFLKTGVLALGQVLILINCQHATAVDEPIDASRFSFQSDVLPVLKRNCLKCHGVSKKEGQLQLHSAVRVWKGGENGQAVVASHPSESLLWTRVEQNEMPPEKPLTEQEKRILHDWIAQGADGLPKSDAEAESMRQDEHWGVHATSAWGTTSGTGISVLPHARRSVCTVRAGKGWIGFEPRNRPPHIDSTHLLYTHRTPAHARRDRAISG